MHESATRFKARIDHQRIVVQLHYLRFVAWADFAKWFPVLTVITAGEQSDTVPYPNEIVEQHSISSLNASARRYEFEAIFQLWTGDLIREIEGLSPGLSVIGTLLNIKTKLIVRDVADHVVVKAKDVAGMRIEQQRWVTATAVIDLLHGFNWRPSLAIVRTSPKNDIDGALGL
jgi:hypothetical protein